MRFPLFLYSLIACFLLSLIKYNYISPRHLKLFPYYLFINILIEITGYVTLRMGIRNIWLFNIYTPLEFIFWAYIYSQSISNKKIKNAVLIFIPGYLILVIINQTLIQGFFKFHSNTFLLGSLSLILFSVYYLYELFAFDLKKNPFAELLFWISVGLLLFYSADFIYLSVYNYLTEEKIEVARILQKAVRINNFIMYVIFIIGLLCLKKTQK